MGKRIHFLFGAALFGAFALLSCAGGGSSDIETGRLALYLTDQPSGDFSQVLVTFDRVLLLGDNGPAVIYSGPETVDLLALRDTAALFAVSPELLTGVYDKIRLEVSSVELVFPEGPPSFAKISSGKIDLNPREPFVIAAGGVLTVLLDLDAKESIHVAADGDMDKYVFRPVVFVTLGGTEPFLRLVKAEGEVVEVGPPPGTFTLSLSGGLEPASKDEHPPEKVLSVHTTPETSIFGPDGMAGTFSLVQPGAGALAAGFPREDLDLLDADKDGDEGEETPGLSAVLVAIGAEYSDVNGLLAAPPTPSGAFTLLLPEGLPVPAILTPGALLYGRMGTAIALSALATGDEVRLGGVWVEGVFRTVLLVR